MIATGISTAILYGAAYFISDFIRHASSSVIADLVLMTLIMVLLLGCAFVGALLVAGYLFGQRWVDRYFGDEGEDDSMEAILAPAQNNALRLSFVLLPVALVHLLVMENVVTDHFHSYYQDTGRLTTMLRSDEEGTRLSALIEMSDEQGPLLTQYVSKMIVPLLDSDDPVAREQALAAIAYVGERMNYSMDLVNRGLATPAGWEGKLLGSLRQKVAPKVSSMTKEGNPESTRALALETLGSIRNRSTVQTLEEALRKTDEATEIRRSALVGLSQMKGQLNAVPILAHVLEQVSPHSREAGLAAYALGEVIGLWTPSEQEETAPPAFVNDALDALTSRLTHFSPGNQCIAVDAIRKMRNREARAPLFAHFENEQSDFLCPDDSMDRERRTALNLSEPEAIRIRTLRAIAYIARNPAGEMSDIYHNEVLGWLRHQQLNEDKYKPEIIRELKNVDEMTGGVPQEPTQDTPTTTGCHTTNDAENPPASMVFLFIAAFSSLLFRRPTPMFSWKGGTAS